MSTPTNNPPTFHQPYAPTPYIPPSVLTTATLPLDQEATLFTSSATRELYASLAEIHAILVSLEFLEKAFIKDTIPADAYAPVCQRLINQYESLLDDPAVAAELRDAGGLDGWKRRYGVQCPTATRRLGVGVPATAGAEEREEPGEVAEVDGKWVGVSAKEAAEATRDFITMMDALRLHYRVPEELHPLLASVVGSVDKVRKGRELETRKGLVKWLVRLNQMKAGEEVGEEEEREMLWDVERGYGEFIEKLG